MCHLRFQGKGAIFIKILLLRLKERVFLSLEFKRRQPRHPPPGGVLRRGWPQQDGQPRPPPHWQVQRPQQPGLPPQHRARGVPGLS